MATATPPMINLDALLDEIMTQSQAKGIDTPATVEKPVSLHIMTNGWHVLHVEGGEFAYSVGIPHGRSFDDDAQELATKDTLNNSNIFLWHDIQTVFITGGQVKKIAIWSGPGNIIRLGPIESKTTNSYLTPRADKQQREATVV